MTSPASHLLIRAVAGHPVLAAHVLGMTVTLAVLVAIALARPRTFAAVLDDAAIESRTDRRLLLGALFVVWSVAWPVTLVVAAAGVGWRR